MPSEPIKKIKFSDKVSVAHNSRNVCSVYMDVKAGWEQWVLLSSDRHHDSRWCDRDLEIEHLEKAKSCRGCLIKRIARAIQRRSCIGGARCASMCASVLFAGSSWRR